MIESGERLDAGRLQLVYHTAVEVEPLWIGPARALRKDARPGDREAIGIGADFLHQRNILLVPVVVIVSDVAGVVVLNVARSMGVGVPDRFAFFVLVPSTF